MTCQIIPKKILKNIAENDESGRKSFYNNIIKDTKDKEYREKRKRISQNIRKGIEPNVDRAHTEQLTIYDNQNSWEYITTKLLEDFIQNHTTHPNKTAKRLFTKDLDKVYDFYHDSLDRESFDDQNAIVKTYLKYGKEYPNAYFDGEVLAFGTGDGYYFNDFSKCFDVLGHEFTHSVIQYEANLEYSMQAGALNESIADVFGITIFQKKYNQSVEKSKWIIGEKIFTKNVNGVGLRSMKNPGTAYDDKVIGKDEQPFDMSGYVNLPDTEDGDNGGVHINSSIFNRIYYLTNEKLGGYSWNNGSVNIWYNALLKVNGLPYNATFTDFANKLIEHGSKLCGNESKQVEALKSSIDIVGVKF